VSSTHSRSFSILVSLPTNKQTSYELKNIYTHSRDEYFYWWYVVNYKNIYRFINVKAGRPILPGIGTNSQGSKFRTGTNCRGNFGRAEHLAARPSSLIHRFVYTENECDLWGTFPVSFPIFVVSSSCKRLSGLWKKLKWSFGNAFWRLLVALCRWSLKPVKLFSINRRGWGWIKVVVNSRLSLGQVWLYL
jgi:hypothetical protein